MKSDSLDVQYRELFGGDPNVPGIAAEPKQKNPFNIPTGFHRVLTANGEDRGLGFYCPTCKLHLVAGLTEQSAVAHCGKVTRFPKGLFGLLKRLGLKSYQFQRRWY